MYTNICTHTHKYIHTHSSILTYTITHTTHNTFTHRNIQFLDKDAHLHSHECIRNEVTQLYPLPQFTHPVTLGWNHILECSYLQIYYLNTCMCIKIHSKTTPHIHTRVHKPHSNTHIQMHLGTNTSPPTCNQNPLTNSAGTTNTYLDICNYIQRQSFKHTQRYK